MTVCIAALYDSGEGVALASDRMVTAHIPIGYEFEYDEHTKIVELAGSQSVYALVAGDVLRAHEILNVAQAEMAQRDGGVTASEAAEVIRKSYQQVRLNCIVHWELEPRGLDLGSYYGRQQQLSQQIVQMIDQAMCNTNLGVEVIVAGPSGQAYTIHTVLNPGTVVDNSAIGYAAIGSGSPHALFSMIEESYTASLGRDDVVELVGKAKKRSEVAPGVGRETTTLVIPREESVNVQQAN